MKRPRRRDDLLDVLLELRAAEERGDPMPPIQCDEADRAGWTAPAAPGDPFAVDNLPNFACRVCGCREYLAVGKSRKGAGFYSCVGCSLVFTAPEMASKPAHEQITPGFAHLSPRRAGGVDL